MPEHSFAPRDDYAAPARPPRRKGPIAAVALVAAVLVGVLVVLAAQEEERERDERAARAVAIAELRRAIAVRQAPHDGAAPELKPAPEASPDERRAARRRLVGAAEDAVLRDARGRARTGELDRDVIDARCGPILKSKEAVPDDRVLSKTVGRYDCVAVTAEVPGGGALGFAFVVSVDFRTFAFTWCRNTPAQGERGEALVFVRLDRACLRTTGRALGTGYVDDGES